MRANFVRLHSAVAFAAAGSVLALATPAAADNWNTGGSGTITSNPGVRVGIGNTGPTALLDVSNNGSRPAQIVNQASTGTQTVADFQRTGASKLKIDNSGLVGIANGTPTAQLDVLNSGSRTAELVNQTATTTQLVADFQRNGVSKLKIDSQGRVGIGLGTTSPSQALHVSGNGFFTGFVQADSGIKVKTWSMEVPDYVFDSERYKVKSLDELDRFIKQERHLPEMPSASELKENGMDLAEMNLRLLKKVEELTLYAIEQDKRIKDLAARVDGKPDASRRHGRRPVAANLK
jgi:hypothetical protein